MPSSPLVVPAPTEPHGPEEVVVVWTPPHPSAALASVLDPVETDRLAAFARAEDRDRYATGCWLVRALVGEASGTTPSAVVVDRTCRRCGGGHGRPRVEPPLAVSVTHSGERVGVALAHGGTSVAVGDGAGVGLDVSTPEDRTIIEEVAQAVMAPAELAWATTEASRSQLWVAKEAVLKAAGVGLLIEPIDVVLKPTPDGTLALLRWPLPVRPFNVHILALAPGMGHGGALAWIGSRPPRLRERWVSGP